MKIFIAFIIIICSIPNIYSQELMADFKNNAHSFLSANVGLSIPGGRYGHKTIYGNYNNPYSINVPKLPRTGASDYNVIGFANPGININIKGAWFFYKIFGVGMNISFSQNFLAVKKLNKAYSIAYNDNPSFDFLSNDFYYSILAMPGIYFSVPIGSDIALNLDAGFGPQYIHTPNFECNYIIDNNNYKEITNSASDWDYSYYISLGVMYKYDKHLGFTFNLMYNELTLNYDFITIMSNITQTSNFNLFFKNMNLAVGVMYLFK